MGIRRKLTVCILTVALICTSVPLVGLATEEAPLAAIIAAEMALYGETAPTLSIVKRVEQLEVDLMGMASSGPLVDRIAVITEILERVGSGTSIHLRVSALEWYSTRRISADSLEARVANLETLYLGGPQGDSLIRRIDRLVKMTFPQGKFDVALVKVPDGTTLKIKILTELNSESSQVDDPVHFVLLEDLKMSNRLIIPAGTEGTGTVKVVSRATQLGLDGKVEVDFGSIRAIDGSMVPIKPNPEAFSKNKSLPLAIGAGAAGFFVLGSPIGLLASFLVKGQNVNIPYGTEVQIQVRGPIPVGGLGNVR